MNRGEIKVNHNSSQEIAVDSTIKGLNLKSFGKYVDAVGLNSPRCFIHARIS